MSFLGVAARADAAGKGFAVVADEVGRLASGSAEAAKQTAVPIRNSVESVTKGAYGTKGADFKKCRNKYVKDYAKP